MNRRNDNRNSNGRPGRDAPVTHGQDAHATISGIGHGAWVRRSGFTLVEALVALGVLGLAVGAILTPISIAIQQQRRAAKMTVATVLAEQAVEECLSHERFSFDDFPVLGPSAEEPWRDQYDERCDYHNISETAGEFGMVDGPSYVSEFTKLRRTMWMQPVYLSGQSTALPPRILMLTVRVYDGDEELVTLRRFVRNEE